MAWTNRPQRTKVHHQLVTWARTNLPNQCAQCGATENLQLDHIKNLARGGTDTTDNIQWLCKPCHQTKTAHESSEWRRKIKRKPRQPIGLA